MKRFVPPGLAKFCLIRAALAAAVAGLCALPVCANATAWTDIGTTTTLTSGRLCKTDGTNIMCDSTAPVISSGAVGIGTATPNASALVDVYSTTQGFLTPRMDTTARDAIASPALGLLIYNTSTNLFNVYNGTSWTTIGGDGTTAFSFPQGTVTVPGLFVTGDANTGLYQSAADTLSITAGGVEVLRGVTTASGVNYFSFAPSATGNAVTLSSAGSDTDVGITVAPKGVGALTLTSGATTGNGLVTNANSLTTGTALSVASTSTAGGASGASYVIKATRSGANANTAHTAYGVYSTVTNTNATSGTNVAGYFSASGATTGNYGLIVAAGNVGVGTAAPDASALMEMKSTDLGFLAPRMDTTHRDAIVSPATGLMIYNTSTNLFNVYNGSSWAIVGSDGTTNLSFPAGTVTAPGLYVTGDSNTGLYQASADTLSITAGGKEVLRGVTTASAVNYFNFAPSATGGSLTMSAAGSDTDVGIAFMPKGAGYVGIGTAVPAYMLDVVGKAKSTSHLFPTTTGFASPTNGIAIAGWLQASGNIYFTGGNVGIGTSTPATPLEVLGNTTITGTMGLGGTTITSSAPALSVTQTWNAGGVAFTGIKENITNTASASGSLLIDLQVGSVSKFKVDKTGVITADGSGLTALNATSLASGTVGTARLGSGSATSTTFLRGDGVWAAAGNPTWAAGTVTAPGWAVTGDSNTGLYQALADTVSITAGGTEIARFDNNAAASYVNYFKFAGSATGNATTLSTSGTDTDVSMAIMPKGAGKVGIGTATVNHFVDIYGNLGIKASSYINFGSTDGSTGYGIRDNSGTLEYKNSGGSWSAPPFDLAMYYPGTLGASAFARVVVTRAVTFPVNLTGSTCLAKTGATSSTTITLKKISGGSSSTVGTVVFAAGGGTNVTNCTYTAASGISLAAGDALEFSFPGTADATLSDVAITLAGTRS